MYRRQTYLPNGTISSSGIDNRAFDASDASDASEQNSDLRTEDDMDPVFINERQDMIEQMEDHVDSTKKNWNVFKTQTPEKKQSHSLRFWNRVHVGVRVTLCFALFVLVLASSCLSKVLFLVTAYNINATNRGNHTYSSREVNVNVSWVWSMILIVTAPYAFTVFRNILRVIFKKTRPVQFFPFASVLLFETCHCIGLCLFLFLVAPSFNPLIILMLCQGIGTIPSIGKLFWTRKVLAGVENSHEGFTTPVWKTISVVSCLLHVAFIGISVWKVYQHTAQPQTILVLLPVSLVLISMRWWDNFIQRKKSKYGSNKEKSYERFARPDSLTALLKQIDSNRVKIDLYVSVWKIVLTLVIPAIVLGTGGHGCQETFAFKTNMAKHCGIIPGYTNVTLIYTEYDGCGDYLPFLIAIISIVSSGIGYKMAKSACKIRSQMWCFSVPLVLATPLSYILVLISYSQPGSVSDYIGCHLSWFHIPNNQDIFQNLLKDYTTDYYFPIVIAGFLTILFTCAHIWVPSANRVAATDKLFNRPLYCGVFFDVSLMMNRRSDDNIKVEHDRQKKIYEQEVSTMNHRHKQDAKIPMVYVCVTMWHENETEMLQLLKSIFRMDQDQSVRDHVQEMMGTPDKDFYRMEAHILFDNAFGDPKADEDPYLINKWVKTFLSTIDHAVKELYISIGELHPPVKVITPYGGRLQWTMPGGNLLIVHLKHQEKIRIKKRWSQVMYMYYLLTHKLIFLDGIKGNTLGKLAKNTFILTLDGDVDFQPSAVQMLLDRMKKSSKVGAACGRIHPIGSGPVVWYQKFEYAMSHWLQKAAEHMIGCVLCSPGCFSMFRASALMDDNVIRKYTELAKEPRQFVQYDQGEDRWLCTLLLQQGHRIEYCAAADAKTYAPEGFKEFYNQRRRWTPSTMANILDVLRSAERIRQKNENISLLYIIYQGFLFVSSVLTPGTIFLLVFSAINTAYPALPLYWAMLLNLIPVVIFVILLFTAKPDIQISYAGILSIVYALVMMVVLVGVFKQIVESNFCSMSAAFFLFIVGIFLLSALLHPQEFVNVIHGFLYFMAIPCMSMLLMFYSFGNLNVVSWGTRETHTVTPTPDAENLPDKKKGKRMAIHDFLKKMKGSDDSDSDYVFSFGNLLRCICCPRPVLRDHTSKMELLLEKMEDVEYAVGHRNDSIEEENYNTVAGVPDNPTTFSEMSMMMHGSGGIRSNKLFQQEPKKTLPENDKDNTPRWTRDKTLGEGETERLSGEEDVFWRELIKTYLSPIHLSEKEKQDMADGLTGLRNTVCTFFFLSNCLFVTLMFILESVSEYTPALVFHLPCDSGDGGATREPVAIAFTLIFGILLLVQFLCMLMHRFSTLLAIASITKFHFKSEATQERKREELVAMVEDMYKVNNRSDWDNVSLKSTGSSLYGENPGNTLHKNDPLFHRLLRDSKKPNPTRPNFLCDIFAENMLKVCDNMEEFQKLEEEGDIRGARKILPELSNQSILAIAQMAKFKDKREKMKEMAKSRWMSLAERVKPRGFVDVVHELQTKSNHNARNDTDSDEVSSPSQEDGNVLGHSLAPMYSTVNATVETGNTDMASDADKPAVTTRWHSVVEMSMRDRSERFDASNGATKDNEDVFLSAGQIERSSYRF